MDLRPRCRGYPKVAGCSRIRDKGGLGQTSGAEGGRDSPGRPKRAEAGSELTGDETTSQLLPCAIRTEPRETEEAGAEAMDRSGESGACAVERLGAGRSHRVSSSPPNVLASKPFPSSPPYLSSFSQAKQDPAHHHLLHLVLPYLPAKPLHRLCCVSPLWNGCISNQFFVHPHSLHPRPIFGFFFHRRRSNDTSCKSETPAYAPFDHADHVLLDPTLSFLPKPIVAAASTHGLLCCRGRISDGYYVCNPTTITWVALPPPTNDHGAAADAVALIFDEPGVYNFQSNTIFFHFFLFDLNRLI